MTNERITEDIVRTHFKSDPSIGSIIIEEQKSVQPRINKYLENASKSGSGVGKPEFIISFLGYKYQSLLIVIECKGNTFNHESKKRNRYKDYAVDGALLYSSYLSLGYDVISIAVSGQDTSELMISAFIQLHGSTIAEPIAGNSLFSIDDYLKTYASKQRSKTIGLNELLVYSRKLNDFLHNKKIKESQRSLLISGILIALESNSFRETYPLYDSKELANLLVSTLNFQLQRAGLQKEKIENLSASYLFIKTHPSLCDEPDTLKSIVGGIQTEILDFIKNNHYYDALGQFYLEFLRYANSDKGLGIVLTPPHITELMCELTELNKNSIVYDNCTGTSGFLISSMKLMVEDANGDSSIIKHIKEKQLVGVEYQEDILALAISNMFIHGDGKSNVIGGDCFDESIINSVKTRFNPSIGLLNPPYKTQRNDREELEFLFNNLDILRVGGVAAAIIPISIVLATSGKRYELKKRLLRDHTLLGVFSMPDELFLNSHASVITCVIVVKAKIPHNKDNEVFLGYWKDDGFSRIKYKGRVDSGRWLGIKNEWINAYRNKRIIPGRSITKSLTAEDEWCAEAHMITDVSLLESKHFEQSLKRMSLYLFNSGLLEIVSTQKEIDSYPDSLFDRNWKPVSIHSLFTVDRGKEKAQDAESGSYPLVMATRENNGVSCYMSEGRRLFPAECITVVGNGASTGEAFVQPKEFYAGIDVGVLKPIEPMHVMSKIFISCVIRREAFRFSYGRKWTLDRLKNHEIFLPHDAHGNVDFDFMISYMMTQSYSRNVINYFIKEI